jgi:hypothetical protein
MDLWRMREHSGEWPSVAIVLCGVKVFPGSFPGGWMWEATVARQLITDHGQPITEDGFCAW